MVAVLGLLTSGLALAGTGVAAASTAPGHTIATAGTLTVGDGASGGGGPVDFWKVHLNGGDRVAFTVDTPTPATFVFQLFAPGANDANFAAARPFSSGQTNDSSTVKSRFNLQAPYTGTFILAVCENVNLCSYNYNGSGSPMDPYTFTTVFVNGGVSSATAARETRAGASISAAKRLRIGRFEAGGANGTDFWKVHLNGGDRVAFTVDTPTPATFVFQLFAPGANDANFAAARPFSSGQTNDSSTVKSRFNLQAPYTGTFILAVCENVNLCSYNYNGSGSPMDPYTFTTKFAGHRVSSATAARETRAGASISAAKRLRIGRFEAGGANGTDFWKVHLNGGDRVAFTVDTPTPATFTFQLFAPGANDANFAAARPFSSGQTNDSSTVKSRFNLRAPYTGTFVLAVCENTNSCSYNYNGGSGSPMNPYTFTTRQTGGRETRTSLRLSARTVTYRHEKALRFHVAVRAVYGGHPRGKVAIAAGRKWLCTVRLVHGKGQCSPRSNTRLRAGRYWVRASYRGNFRKSRSRAVRLRVRK